jgi:signal transduction histidine kinase
VLRLGFYGILLHGVDAEPRHDLPTVRRANEELHRLHETDLARAALEERARLAREVHDGLAQDLWYAKLKQGRLARLPELGADARQLADEVAFAVDSALTEARQAVMALRPQHLEGDSFREVVARYVDDFGDRFGLRTELDADPELPQLEARTQAEMLRIVQEAMNNVRRHADATMVRVRMVSDGPRFRIEVSDNGRGFDVNAPAGGGYGLQSMRERAALIGGTLTVASAVQDGATVALDLPVDESATPSVQTDA